MLFKTISASVYGIDAYLVEVEVDSTWTVSAFTRNWDYLAANPVADR
jgi:hypothetical protein